MMLSERLSYRKKRRVFPIGRQYPRPLDGYPHELWTTRLLAGHAREHGPAQGHACLADLAQGTV
jgi:hypothetical protein